MAELAIGTSGRPDPGARVRESVQGTWFAAAPGSVLRLPAGADPVTLRRLQRLALPGLLPIGDVWKDGGRLWAATPLPPGPTVADLLTVGPRLGLGPRDAAAVLGAVGRSLRALYARGLGHGTLDASAVLVAPDGAPVLVAVTAGPRNRERDLADWAQLAWTLADGWGRGEPAVAGDLRGCADLAEAAGMAVALESLPLASDGAGRRRAVRAWAAEQAGHTGDRAVTPAVDGVMPRSEV